MLVSPVGLYPYLVGVTAWRELLDKDWEGGDCSDLVDIGLGRREYCMGARSVTDGW